MTWSLGSVLSLRLSLFRLMRRTRPIHWCPLHPCPRSQLISPPSMESLLQKMGPMLLSLPMDTLPPRPPWLTQRCESWHLQPLLPVILWDPLVSQSQCANWDKFNNLSLLNLCHSEWWKQQSPCWQYDDSGDCSSNVKYGNTYLCQIQETLCTLTGICFLTSL